MKRIFTYKLLFITMLCAFNTLRVSDSRFSSNESSDEEEAAASDGGRYNPYLSTLTGHHPRGIRFGGARSGAQPFGIGPSGARPGIGIRPPLRRGPFFNPSTTLLSPVSVGQQKEVGKVPSSPIASRSPSPFSSAESNIPAALVGVEDAIEASEEQKPFLQYVKEKFLNNPSVNEKDMWEIVGKVEQNPALLHAKDENGDTLLHLAAAQDKDNLIKALIDMNLLWGYQFPLNNNGETAFLVAIKNGSEKGAKELFKVMESEGLNIGDSSGKTPLHWAHLRGDSELETLLGDWGANLDQKDNDGYKYDDYKCGSEPLEKSSNEDDVTTLC